MKFNLKGLNLNMLLLVAILVGVVVVFLRQNNKCMMDEDDDDDDDDEYEDGVEEFRQKKIMWKPGIDKKKLKTNGYRYGRKIFRSLFTASLICRRNPNCVGIEERKNRRNKKNKYKLLWFRANKKEEKKRPVITEPAEPCVNCVCGTKCGNRHSPFATFRGVGVGGFTPIGTYTTKPLEQVLTDCDNNDNCQGVIAYGNNKILMQNTDESTILNVSNDNPNINSYIRWNKWMEQGRGYDTMMILPDGREREMNWDTFTTI